MKHLALAVAALFVSAAASSADVKIAGQLAVPANRIARLEAQGDTKGAGLIWDYDDSKLDGEEIGSKLYLTGPPGIYSVRLRAVRFDGATASVQSARAHVTIGDPGPGPGPDPGPGPGPGPGPVPGPAGLRVLIVYESAEGPKLPAPQRAVLYGAQLRTWLNTNCAVGPDGKTREWGIFDKDDDLSSYSKPLQALMVRPHPTLPWLEVSNGKAGFEGPLPADVDSTLALLKKFATSGRR